MDVVYFLKGRTNFIRFYYDQCVVPFAKIKHQIENHLPPFDDPPYSEDPEPPYLDKWMDAHMAFDIAGFVMRLTVVRSFLKLYFASLQHRVIGFRFGNKEREKNAFKEGVRSCLHGGSGSHPGY